MTSPIHVRAIEHPRDTRALLRCWWRVYRDDPHWIPPLISERKAFFHPEKNPYFRVADVQCFIASRNGEDLGTIAATVDHVYQEHEPGVGFFGFFEFVDDLTVARELLDAATRWLAERGMHRVIGPFNFNTNHEFGLLVDGFDTDPMVANPHNSAYFPGIYDALGLEKAMDWYAYKFDLSTDTFARMRKISDRFMSRHPEISLRPLDMKNFDREIDSLQRIYTDAWEQNWGHVRITDAEFRHLAAGFRSILDGSLCYVAEIGGEPVAMSVTLPDYNQVVKGMKGRILPIGWLHFLLERRKIDRGRVFMLGVRREYQHLPLGAPIYIRSWDRARELGYRFGEASLILEDNTRMRGAVEKMGGTIYKTYRNYRLELSSSGSHSDSANSTPS